MSPGAPSPKQRGSRIKSAAEKTEDYQPSLSCPLSNATAGTLTIGILVPELGDGYHTQVMGGIGDHLMEAGYFYFTAHHRHRKNLVEDYSRMLLSRGAEALITIDTRLEHGFPVPVVAVAGHKHIHGVTNIVLDHCRFAAELTLESPPALAGPPGKLHLCAGNRSVRIPMR